MLHPTQHSLHNIQLCPLTCFEHSNLHRLQSLRLSDRQPPLIPVCGTFLLCQRGRLLLLGQRTADPKQAERMERLVHGR